MSWPCSCKMFFGIISLPTRLTTCPQAGWSLEDRTPDQLDSLQVFTRPLPRHVRVIRCDRRVTTGCVTVRADAMPSGKSWSCCPLKMSCSWHPCERHGKVQILSDIKSGRHDKAECHCNRSLSLLLRDGWTPFSGISHVFAHPLWGAFV